MSNPIDKAISVCNGLSNLAAKIGATSNQVTNWRIRGVPIEFCWPIEQATNGAVTRKDLCPDDWARIWPDLKE